MSLLVSIAAAPAADAEAEGEAAELKARTIELEPGEKIDSEEGRVTQRLRLYRRAHEVDDKRLRVEIATGVEAGGHRRTEYLRSVVPLDDQGKPHGKELRYLSPRWNERERLVPWVHGVKHGVEKEFTGWGQSVTVASEVPWNEGEMSGTRRTFDAGGNVLSETPYVKGQPHGKSTTYDKDGRLVSEVVYVEGRKHGDKTEYWTETGEPRRIIPYKNGLAHGQMIAYHLNGQVKRKVACREGLLHGEEVVYSDEGNVITRRFWLDGERVSEAEFEVAQREGSADQGNEG